MKSESRVQAASDLHDLRHALKDGLANVGILSAACISKNYNIINVKVF